MEKWERRDMKRRKRRSQDMVVRGRSLRSTIVPTIVKRGEQVNQKRESLQQVWDAYKGEENRVGKFRHIALLIGYKEAEIQAFLDGPSDTQNDEDEA